MSHSRVAPSLLNRTCECTASLNFSGGSELPDLENDEAELGTVAHELSAAKSTGDTFEHPLIDQQMEQHTDAYVEYCKALGGESFVEFKVYIQWVHDECYGTLDYGAIVGRTLHIVDLKYGYRLVEAKGNRQLLAYAKGLMEYLKREGYQIDEIVLHIFQPRIYHREGYARTWSITPHELDNEINEIAQQVAIADSDKAYFETGTHCYKCPRLHDCNAATTASYNAIDVVLNQHTSVNSDSTQLGNDLLMIEHAERVLKDRKTALKEVLEFRIKSGVQCPTHCMEQYNGNRKWKVSNDHIEAEAALAGIDDVYKSSIKSPAALEKEGLDKKIVKSMVTQPSYGKLTAVDFNRIKKVFNND